MKKRINKKASVFLVASVLSFSFATVASIVSATTAHPAPSPIIDVWEYGVNDTLVIRITLLVLQIILVQNLQ